jgi:hypothetical protein
VRNGGFEERWKSTPLTLKEIARKFARTGGPIVGLGTLDATGKVGNTFATVRVASMSKWIPIQSKFKSCDAL